MKQKVFLYALLLIAAWLPFTATAHNYDFSAVSPSGDTLYYKLNDNDGVDVVGPIGSSSRWDGYTKPTGHLIIPDTVSYMGVNFPVTTIGNSAFEGCRAITAVTIPNSVSSIMRDAFYNCTSLTSVTIPNSVNEIWPSAFMYCTSLTSVTIPNSVTSIWAQAFYGCTSLDSVIVLTEDADILNAFPGTSISYLYWNNNYAYNNGLADIPKGNLQTVVFGNAVTAIPENAFLNATQLRHVTLGSGITEIGDNAFRFCNSIDTIVALPTVAPTLGTNALQGVPNTAVVVTSCGADYTTAWGANTFTYTSANAYTLTLGVNNAAYGAATFVQSVDCQQTAIIQATPAANCVFNGWSDGNTDNPRTITLTGNTTLTANFTKTHAVVTAQSSSNMMGEVQGSGTYAIGSSATLTANALCNYRFVRWHDNVTANPRTISVQGDTVFTAYFELNSDTVTLVDTVTLTDTLYVDVHDTSYVTLTDTLYVDVHDTSYVTLTDTLYVDVHDTSYITLTDTLYVDVHDTSYVTLTDTLYVDVHDTSYVTLTDTLYVDVHDTSYVTLTDTLYVDVHDTSYVTQTVHDTVTVRDTIVSTEYVEVHDTVAVYDTITNTEYVEVHDTVAVYDTITNTEYVEVHDTVAVYDTVTNMVYDTVAVTDTVVMDNYLTDTLYVTDTLYLWDTIYVTDTVVVHDTVYVREPEGVGDVQTTEYKIYSNGTRIVVEGAMGERVRVYDVAGRLVGSKEGEYGQVTVEAPGSGSYLIKVGQAAARKVVVVR